MGISKRVMLAMVMVAAGATSTPAVAEEPGALKTHEQFQAAAVAQLRAEEAAEMKIYQALSKPISVDYDDEPLAEVLEDLSAKMNVNILLDHEALDEIGIDEDSPVYSSLKNVSAQSVLKILMRRIDPELTWTIQHESLLFTTKEYAAERLTTQFFDVGDLVTFIDNEDRALTNYDAVIELIQTTVEPETWLEVGGEGSISPFEATGITVLVVQQTPEVQIKVAALLEQIRSHRDPEALKDGKFRRSPGLLNGEKDSSEGVDF